MANKNNHSFASQSLRFVKNTAIPLKLDSLERDVERSHGRKPSSIHHEIKRIDTKGKKNTPKEESLKEKFSQNQTFSPLFPLKDRKT